MIPTLDISCKNFLWVLYMEGMDLNWREKKDYKPKGPLTKTLLDKLRKVFAVQEIVIKDTWSEHIHDNLTFTPEQYVWHLSLMCCSAKRIVSDIYDRFLIVISIVTCIAELTFVATGRNFYKLTPQILSVFFENVLRKNFDKRGGWKRLEKHIVSRKYLECYDDLVASNFDPDEELRLKIRKIFLITSPSISFPISENEREVTRHYTDHLTRKVMRSIEPSLLMQLSFSKLNKEPPVPTQAEGLDPSKKNIGSSELQDKNTKNSFETDLRVCIKGINKMEEKLRDLISIFELLDTN
ncbi:uncharacterized protein NPIL_448191 [Nephila pilipes]|uniref:Uncharacterized protein n=1 Tax=Nephila pilipes TaxID=299642 RepID=A0A8X6IKN9_NEPPI|nr:uncharacterized protein NPIL_448191 [Nephila pilipes]